jgi:hypothetical protein
MLRARLLSNNSRIALAGGIHGHMRATSRGCIHYAHAQLLTQARVPVQLRVDT